MVAPVSSPHNISQGTGHQAGAGTVERLGHAVVLRAEHLPVDVEVARLVDDAHRRARQRVVGLEVEKDPDDLEHLARQSLCLVDEYYGVPRTSNEAMTTIAQGQTAPNTSFIWEGRAGSPPRNVKPFDLAARRTVDREAAEKSVAFMERSVRDRKPVFLYYPMILTHDPFQPTPDSSDWDPKAKSEQVQRDVKHFADMTALA